MYMKGIRRFLIPILLVCLTASQIATTHADDYIPYLQVTTKNTTLAAGSKGSISITFYNGGNFDVTEIEALLTSTTPGVSILDGSQYVNNKISSGTSATYTPNIIVDQSIGVGAYLLTMTLSYLRAGRGIVTESIPITIVVNQPSLPAVRITTSESIITPGAETVVTLTVENMGNTSIKDVDITLTAASPLLTLTDQINNYFTELKAGTSTSYDVKIKALENIPIGAYSLTAQVWYINDSGVEAKQTISIPLEVTTTVQTKSPVITIANLNPSRVIPGEQFSIDLQASCSDAAVYNVKAVLSPDVTSLISPLNPTTVSLGDLPIGGNAKFTYILLLSGAATAGDIPLTVTVKYIDSKGVQGVATETITIPVENLVQFSLMEDLVITAQRGSNQSLEADLLLVGTGKVEFTRIQVLPDIHVNQIAGSTQYIGAIDPDSPVPFTLKYAVNSNSTTGDYSLKLRITYLDSRNTQQNSTISVPLTITNPSTVIQTPSSNGGIWGWLKRLFGLQ
jgi:hypothetical protein